MAEVKHRKDLPRWIVGALNRAISLAGEKRLPMVVLTSSKSPSVLVVMDLKDYRQWYVGKPRKRRRSP